MSGCRESSQNNAWKINENMCNEQQEHPDTCFAISKMKLTNQKPVFSRFSKTPIIPLKHGLLIGQSRLENRKILSVSLPSWPSKFQ